MPELPDVYLFDRYLKSVALHQEIESSSCLDEGVLKEVSRQGLQRALKGGRLTETERCGKLLFARVEKDGDEPGWLVVHFGMTGELEYGKDEGEPPRFARFLLRFENGYRLAYVSARKLGFLSFTDDWRAYVEEHEIGPDALEVSWEEFRERIGGRRGGLKLALMNQSVVSGLGNVYVDEILFQRRLPPRSAIGDVGEDELREVYDEMGKVLKVAIDRGGDPERLPDDFLLAHRHRDERCPRCGKDLRKIEVNGRGTFYCRHCQGD